MSFDTIARDLFALFQLAWKVVNTCRQVCGEQELLTREVASLHAVVCQLQQEAERPNSSLRWQDEISRKELKGTIKGSRKVLKVLDQVLAQYVLTLRKGGPKRGLFRSIKFGNGEVTYMSDLLEDLSFHKAALTMNLRLLTPSSRGSVDWPLGKKYSRVQLSIHRMMAEISSSHDGSSFSSSSSDDERTVWEEVKRGLERKGWWSRDVKKHRKALKQYVKSLAFSDSFDEIPPPAHPSMQRHPEDGHLHEEFTQEPFHQEDFPQQQFSPPPMPQQHFQDHAFPPPNLPPPNFIPPVIPQHPFTPPNFSQQTFYRQISPRQEFTRRIFPQPSFTRQIFSPHENFTQASFPPANMPQGCFSNESLPRELYSEGNDCPQSPRDNMGPPPPQQSHYVQPSVSDDCPHFDENPAFVTLPPQPEPQFQEEPTFVTLPPQPDHQFGQQPAFIQNPPQDRPQFDESPAFVTLPPQPEQHSNESPAFVQIPQYPSPPFEANPAFISLPQHPQSHYDEKADFITLPPQPTSQFSVRPGDLADTFQCSPKDTWNDMLESLVTTLIDTSKTLYFPCSICNKSTATGPARLDRSQNWCRNCFHAIVYNVLYYPSSPPSALSTTLRPISQKRMDDIVTSNFIELWEQSYEELRAMRGRPSGGMIVPGEEEPPLILYKNAVVKGEEGRCVRQGYFEMGYFEEPFSSFAARRKQKV